MSLLGRLALVTGGGSGLGKATCQVLAREGASVIVADKNYKTVEETLKGIDSNSKQIHHGLSLDVGKSSSVNNALKEILETYKKPPTIIVNSAGIIRDNFLVKLSEEDFDEVINVNLKGTFLVVQTFAKSIIEHGATNASIINISSIIARDGNIGQTNYSASKAGVILLTKTASKEFGKFGIRVNVILPGFIDTPMSRTIPDKIKAGFLNKIPLGRLGNPEELGEVVAFLASDKSSYINGTSIEVTGGF